VRAVTRPSLGVKRGSHAWATAGVVLVAVVARLPHALSAPLWMDEVASARILSEPTLGGMLGRVARTESTPPLWYAFGWALHRVGVGLVDVRLLSVCAGGLLVLVVVALADEVLPRPAPYVAGLLVALGSQFVVHGRELRAYELLALAAAALALVLVRARRAPTTSNFAVLAAVTAGGLLTHYFFLFSLAAALVWLWLDPQARGIRRAGTLAVGAGVGVSAAWAPWFVRQYGHDRFWWIGAVRPLYVVETPLRLFVGRLPSGAGASALGAVFLLLVGMGAGLLARRSESGRLYAMLALGPLLAAGGLWLAGMRIFAVRNLIELGPFAAIAVAALPAALPARARRPAAAGVVAALAGLAVALPPVAVAPYQLLAGALSTAGWRPSDPIALYGNPLQARAPLEWYLPRRPALYVAGGSAARCRDVFLVVGRARARSLRLRHEISAGVWVVVRERPGLALHGATFLVGRSAGRACVRLSRDPRLAPIL